MNLDKWHHYARARLFELLRKYEVARAEYRLALAADPGFRRAANALGYRCALEGRDAEAIDCFERVLRLDARDPYAHFNLGFVYARAGQPDKAIDRFRSAVELNDKLDRAWYGMGMAYATKRDHRAAMEALERAARLQPMGSPIWYQYAMACHHAREPEKVSSAIMHVNRFDPRTARQLVTDAGRADLAYLVRDVVA